MVRRLLMTGESDSGRALRHDRRGSRGSEGASVQETKIRWASRQRVNCFIGHARRRDYDLAVGVSGRAGRPRSPLVMITRRNVQFR